MPTFSAFHVKHFSASKFWRVSRETFFVKKTKKKLDTPNFSARGRQCESEVQIRLVLRSCGSEYGCENLSLRTRLRKFLFDFQRRTESEKAIYI